MTVGTGKFISRKVSRVRWLPQQDTSQLESSTLVTGSWDDEVSITLASHWLIADIIPAPDWLIAGILVSDWVADISRRTASVCGQGRALVVVRGQLSRLSIR